jgi:hypothetical protein
LLVVVAVLSSCGAGASANFPPSGTSSGEYTVTGGGGCGQFIGMPTTVTITGRAGSTSVAGCEVSYDAVYVSGRWSQDGTTSDNLSCGLSLTSGTNSLPLTVTRDSCAFSGTFTK